MTTAASSAAATSPKMSGPKTAREARELRELRVCFYPDCAAPAKPGSAYCVPHYRQAETFLAEQRRLDGEDTARARRMVAWENGWLDSRTAPWLWDDPDTVVDDDDET